MENITQPNNRIFITAFAGAILLVISLWVSISSAKHQHGNFTPNLIIAAATGVTAIALLSDAIKKDRHRLV